jgi:YidC/Oxa1 family membrane protein insertase
MDPMQQKMMQYFMPALFTAFMLQLPSGLTLYIFTNNILSIAQQLGLRKSMGLPLVGAPSAASTATVAAEKVERTRGKK